MGVAEYLEMRMCGCLAVVLCVVMIDRIEVPNWLRTALGIPMLKGPKTESYCSEAVLDSLEAS